MYNKTFTLKIENKIYENCHLTIAEYIRGGTFLSVEDNQNIRITNVSIFIDATHTLPLDCIYTNKETKKDVIDTLLGLNILEPTTYSEVIECGNTYTAYRITTEGENYINDVTKLFI